MRVKLLTGMVGIGFAYLPGDVIDLPEADVLRMLERELAEPVDTATVVPTETAALPLPIRKTASRRR